MGAGAFSIMLRNVPAPSGRLVAELERMPMIGIGAVDTDGQVRVIRDMSGLLCMSSAVVMKTKTATFIEP